MWHGTGPAVPTRTRILATRGHGGSKQVHHTTLGAAFAHPTKTRNDSYSPPSTMSSRCTISMRPEKPRMLSTSAEEWPLIFAASSAS